ncbi:MAG: hypothetical protein ACRC4L_01320 [Mycoplasma sp.]
MKRILIWISQAISSVAVLAGIVGLVLMVVFFPRSVEDVKVREHSTQSIKVGTSRFHFLQEYEVGMKPILSSDELKTKVSSLYKSVGVDSKGEFLKKCRSLIENHETTDRNWAYSQLRWVTAAEVQEKWSTYAIIFTSVGFGSLLFSIPMYFICDGGTYRQKIKRAEKSMKNAEAAIEKFPTAVEV